jgi:hypothetical protein
MTASLLKSSSKDEGVNPIPPNYLNKEAINKAWEEKKKWTIKLLEKGENYGK